MSDAKQGLFEVVFEGSLVTGKSKYDVSAALAEHYGAEVAKQILAADRLVLKKDAGREEAEKAQKQLYGLGLVTRLNMTKAPEGDLSLAEEHKSAPIKRPTAAAGKPAADDEVRDPRQRQKRSAEELKPKPPYSLAKIDDSFTTEELSVSGVSTGYSANLVGVGMLMILLPLCYVAIVAVVAYATWWHATENISWFTEYRIRYLFIVWAALLFGGILLTAFMFKPLVAKESHHKMQPVTVDPDREAAVHHFVAMIAECLNAPTPATIEVDADVSASASLRHGIFSKELRLIIGVPLMYGLRIEQLAAVIAHELGHFAQRGGMRIYVMINYVNRWLYNKAYEEDSWDDKIEEWSQSDQAIVSLGAIVAGIGSRLARLIFRGLAQLGTRANMSYSRQAEFDADRYMITLCGSRSYETVAKMLRILGAAQQGAFDTANAGLKAGRLPDNLPKITRAVARSLDEETRKQIIAGIEQVNTSPWDTHPPDRERIAAARKLALPPMFQNRDPALALLREPERLAAHASLQWYRSCGIHVNPDHLETSESFVSLFAPKLKL
ncbi:MAG: M48 family metalloprotease [Woeseiaceae bacterium]|nr:M48 family metalloprotease [Woeseiaceae bacterium]